MKFDTLGDWCKWLEKNFSNEIMIPTLPVIIRLDGNNFHNWTKGLERPFDSNLSQLMVSTTKHLVQYTNAIIGYTQSDEITLVLYSDKKESDIFNAGKKQKIISKLSGECANYFNQERPKYLPNHNKVALFDARIYQCPTLYDACLQLQWRENDATKNSISMLAQSHFSHKSLQGLSGNEMRDKLMTEKGINWNDLATQFKKGTYVQMRTVSRAFTQDELAQLPEKHQARLIPHLEFERSEMQVLDLPIFSKIDNKIEVVFYGDSPILNQTL